MRCYFNAKLKTAILLYRQQQQQKTAENTPNTTFKIGSSINKLNENFHQWGDFKREDFRCCFKEKNICAGILMQN